MEIIYYDIGLNLFCRQFQNPEKIIANAAANGVSCILTGTSMKTNRQVSDFAAVHEFVYGTAGIHPHNADSARKDDYDSIERIVTSNPKIVAVGECGLDYDRMYSTRENQLLCLEKHICLAEKLDMPLFLHERAASEDFVKKFKRHRNLCERSVVHCYTGDKKTLDKYLELGFAIGITGWICDEKRGRELREAVRLIPADRILIETDVPYLTPKNVNGLSNVNVPENIVYVARELAKHMSLAEEELLQRARDNTRRIFSLV